MKFAFSHESVDRVKSDCLVVIGMTKKEISKKIPAVLQLGDGGVAIDKKLNGLLTHCIERETFSCELGRYRLLPTNGRLNARHVLLIGGGNPAEFNLDSMRAIGSKLVDIAAEMNIHRMAGVVISQKINEMEAADRVQALIEGVVIGGYRFDFFKSREKEKEALSEIIFIQKGAAAKELSQAVNRGRIIGEAVNYARDLGNMPANILTPLSLANEAKKLARSSSVNCHILHQREIVAQKMGLLAAVGAGSAHPPALIHLSYRPNKKRAQPEKIVLIGKGVTFDSGGLSIKPAKSLETMKGDMAGAAAVLATFRALVELKSPVAVDVIIAAAENAVDKHAMRPGDVFTSRNGKTVEVVNTDAEGRLVLADAIDYAISKKATVIVDVATLTGGVFHALGSQYTALLGNDRKLLDKLLKAGEQSGEPMWELPMPKSYRDGFKSETADMKNMGGQGASTINGAIFLSEFLRENVKWGHLDIAESGWKDTREKVAGLTFLGPTGAPVRALIHFLEHY